eukprot:SAG31_NODE_6558_length_1976_cov_4.575422_3_plen_201_part_00
MSDNESEIPIETLEEPKPAKKKRQLSKEQLEKLAIAREKANKVRRDKAAVKRKEKELAQLEQQAKSASLDKKISKLQGGKAKKTKEPEEEYLPPSSDSEYSTESSEDEPTPPPRNKKKKQPRKKAYKVFEPEYREPPSYEQNPRPRQSYRAFEPDVPPPQAYRQVVQNRNIPANEPEPAQNHYNHQLRTAFNSLFPNNAY